MTNPDQLRELLAVLSELRTTITRSLETSVPSSEDPLVDLLARSQSLVLAHPAESAGLVQALAAIGRRHAATPEGAQLLQGLLASPKVAELRTAWEAVTLNLLDEVTPTGSAPAAWVDLMLDGASAAHIAQAAEQIRPEGFAG